MLKVTTRRITMYDENWGAAFGAPGVPQFRHHCWGPIDPAHVGEKQSQGAYDVGRVVPLCRAAHNYYDERRGYWLGATGLSEADMESKAAGYALKWVERGGTL